jgi:5S rRNA maturation endonuclease (ribonuclease M5)
MNNTKWSEIIILVDAAYVDKVAFDLIVNFERMLGRRIPQADTAQWLECIALDGGLRPIDRGAKQEASGERTVQVVLLHDKKQQQLDNFLPGRFADLDGKAFSGQLGEFLISCVQVEEMVTKDDLYIDSLQIIANAAEVQRLMVVADSDRIYNKVREALRQADPDKHITVFTMQPMTSGNFRQEILGYSLMAALGIKAEEINKNNQ